MDPLLKGIERGKILSTWEQLNFTLGQLTHFLRKCQKGRKKESTKIPIILAV